MTAIDRWMISLRKSVNLPKRSRFQRSKSQHTCASLTALLVLLGLGWSIVGNANAAEDSAKQSDTKVSLEALVMFRDSPGGGALTDDDGGTIDFVPLSSSDLSPAPSGGFRVMLEKPIDSGLAGSGTVQFGGFWAGQFKDRRTISDPAENTDAIYDNNAAKTVNTDNSGDVVAMDFELDTILAGAEINWVPAGDNVLGLSGVKPFIGTRYVYFRETLRSTAFDSLNSLAGIDNDIDRVRISVPNNMVGVHIGVQGDHNIHPRVAIGGRISGGLFANFVTRERSFTSDDLPANVLRDTLDGVGFAQVLEVTPTVKIRVTDVAYLMLSATVNWINGVSEAASHYESVSVRDDSSIRTGGDVLFYGANLGFVVPF